METINVSPEVREFMEGVALGIFTDMVNSGSTFQAALAAVYVSGLQNAKFYAT